MGNLSLLDYDTQKAVFSASAILAVLFGACLLSHFILWLFFIVTVIGAGYTGFTIFIKPRMAKKEDVVVKKRVAR